MFVFPIVVRSTVRWGISEGMLLHFWGWFESPFEWVIERIERFVKKSLFWELFLYIATLFFLEILPCPEIFTFLSLAMQVKFGDSKAEWFFQLNTNRLMSVGFYSRNMLCGKRVWFHNLKS